MGQPRTSSPVRTPVKPYDPFSLLATFWISISRLPVLLSLTMLTTLSAVGSLCSPLATRVGTNVLQLAADQATEISWLDDDRPRRLFQDLPDSAELHLGLLAIQRWRDPTVLLHAAHPPTPAKRRGLSKAVCVCKSYPLAVSDRASQSLRPCLASSPLGLHRACHRVLGL